MLIDKDDPKSASFVIDRLSRPRQDPDIETVPCTATAEPTDRDCESTVLPATEAVEPQADIPRAENREPNNAELATDAWPLPTKFEDDEI